MIADRAPDLPEVLQRLRERKEPNAGLDGTLIRTDRVAPAQPPTRAATCGTRARGRRSGATCRW